MQQTLDRDVKVFVHEGVRVPLLDRLLRRRDELAAGELAELTRALASETAAWRSLVRHDPVQRWYLRLALSESLEVWLIAWAPGQATSPHDHGGALGAMTVTEGTLTEEVFEPVSPQDARLAHTIARATGASALLGAEHVHRVGNARRINATSIHAYSLPDQPMRTYRVPAGLAARP
jgi:predicted metal-dependent enzyme (double-stranded beta helix superfamily)